MGPKPTPSKPGNTLFSYFSKSPAVSKSSQPTNNNQEVLSQKRSPNKPAEATPLKHGQKDSNNLGFQEGDIVWSKLSGYPWWPSLVCSHPTEHTHSKGGKNPQVHVQFFDIPPTRSWIKINSCVLMHDIETKKEIAGYVLTRKGPAVDMEKKCTAIKSSLVNHMESRYSDLKDEVIEATTIVNMKSWPRENVPDFGVKEVQCIGKKFKTTLENQGADLTDLVGEWQMLKSLTYKRDLLKYHGSDHEDYKKGGKCYSMNPKVKRATQEADEALALPIPKRLELVVDLQPSDDENEEMEFDPDIFDDEMDEDMDNSKENKEDEDNNKGPENNSTNKTPKKSPLKRKSARKPQAKRRRIIEACSDSGESDDDFKPHSDDSDEEVSSGVDEDEISEPESESEPDSPVKKVDRKRNPPSRKRKRPEKNSKPWRPSKAEKQSEDEDEETKSPLTEKKKAPGAFTPSVGEKTKSKLASFTAKDNDVRPTKGTEQEANFPHLKHDFLQPENIRDANKKRKSDPDYDPRSVYLPDSFLKQQTPAMRQWWELKAKHFDTVLFFKMGKFYELFHMDAVIAVNELGLIYMKGEHAHSGFPEIAYSRYADTLVQKGYKIARIEQTETPDMMADRVKHMGLPATKFDKVVKREICQITTKGTKTFNVMDGDCTDATSNYLLALAEKDDGQHDQSTYGVCFVDTTIGKFHIGQFTDDRFCSRLRTLIAHFTPVQVLLPKGKISEKTQSMINNNLSSIIKEYLRPDTEFWDSSKTLKVLAESDYFKSDDEVVWPECLKKMISDTDSLGLSAAGDFCLAVSSLGAMTWYLQYCLLDEEVMSMRNFEEYLPLDSDSPNKSSEITFAQKQHMVLDGLTLRNLDVADMYGSQEGTLLARLDQCCTPFGKRLFKQWLCAPLCNPAGINDRLDALEDLNSIPDVVAEVTEILNKLPDLERILSKFHSLGSASRSKNHPESRAIMFDEAKYSKKKIEDFLTTIDGFKSAQKVSRKFQSHVKNFRSKLLKNTMTINTEEVKGHFPDLKEELEFFDNAFDHAKARKDGVIIPCKGVNPDYDNAKSDLQTVEKGLNEYLDQQKQRLGCRTLTYWGSGKNRYQIEVPEAVAKRVPDQYQLMSSKKGAKRYRTKEIENQLVDLTDAEDRKDSALKDTMRRLFYSFDERYKLWDTAIQCLAVLDVLMSLAKYVNGADGVTCRPEIVCPAADSEPFIEIREARHPCVSRTFSGGDFIPNDTVIGIKDENDMDIDETESCNMCSKIVLVTGPNMGGKSTLMRQVGLITVMAQMGSYVPAEKCRLTPVDRVFTRLGASDRIMSGESTFFVELSETSAILQHATKHSLILIDELGRGTATYDGTAIACSVVNELSEKVQCRTLFSTHYHSLVEEFSHDPNIRLGHMSCMVEDEGDPSEETITFLYKFAKGACPKSYGFNAARLANIPEEVIKVAIQKSKEFESSTESKRLIKSLWNEESVSVVKQVQQHISSEV